MHSEDLKRKPLDEHNGPPPAELTGPLPPEIQKQKASRQVFDPSQHNLWDRREHDNFSCTKQSAESEKGRFQRGPRFGLLPKVLSVLLVVLSDL